MKTTDLLEEINNHLKSGIGAKETKVIKEEDDLDLGIGGDDEFGDVGDELGIDGEEEEETLASWVAEIQDQFTEEDIEAIKASILVRLEEKEEEDGLDDFDSEEEIDDEFGEGVESISEKPHGLKEDKI